MSKVTKFAEPIKRRRRRVRVAHRIGALSSSFDPELVTLRLLQPGKRNPQWRSWREVAAVEIPLAVLRCSFAATRDELIHRSGITLKPWPYEGWQWPAFVARLIRRMEGRR